MSANYLYRCIDLIFLKATGTKSGQTDGSQTDVISCDASGASASFRCVAKYIQSVAWSGPSCSILLCIHVSRLCTLL